MGEHLPNKKIRLLREIAEQAGLLQSCHLHIDELYRGPGSLADLTATAEIAYATDTALRQIFDNAEDFIDRIGRFAIAHPDAECQICLAIRRQQPRHSAPDVTHPATPR